MNTSSDWGQEEEREWRKREEEERGWSLPEENWRREKKNGGRIWGGKEEGTWEETGCGCLMYLICLIRLMCLMCLICLLCLMCLICLIFTYTFFELVNNLIIIN